MSLSPLRIWCDLGFDGEAERLLRDGTKGHELILVHRHNAVYPPGQSPDERLAEADICLGRPDPGSAVKLRNIRWVHLPSAGYANYDRDDLRRAFEQRGAVMTNNSSVFDEPCAEHALAMVLALNRQLPQAMKNQITDHHWGVDALLQRTPPLLTGQTMVILGFGAIARRLVELLAPFQMRIIGVRRSPTGDEPVEMVADDRVDEVLPEADHVMNILPINEQTAGSVDASRFAKMKRGAFFYNIGRGRTVDQPALIEALRSGHLAAAYLDVTDPEPLPPDHSLWTAPRCYITPHVAGVHAGEPVRTVRHFLENLRRFERGERLVNQVY